LKGGEDLTLEEVNSAAQFINDELPNLNNVAWGVQIDVEMTNRVRAVVILTGIDNPLFK
jgi:cell division GTPase FtsZ